MRTSDDSEHAQRCQVLAENPDREHQRDQQSSIAAPAPRESRRPPSRRGSCSSGPRRNARCRQATATASPSARTRAVVPSAPNTASTTMRKIGTPSGMVIAIACATDAVSTPRRAAALSAANDAADSSAKKSPEHERFQFLLHHAGLVRHDVLVVSEQDVDRREKPGDDEWIGTTASPGCALSAITAHFSISLLSSAPSRSGGPPTKR